MHGVADIITLGGWLEYYKGYTCLEVMTAYKMASASVCCCGIVVALDEVCIDI